MKYEHIANLVFNQPWAILPAVYTTIMDLIAFKAEGGVLTEEEIRDRIGAVQHPGKSRSGAVAVLPLHGVLAQRMNMMSAMSGGTSTEIFGKMFTDAVADPAIGGIVINIDSPGGSVFGVQELWQTVFNARGEKPIVAMVNSVAASAAYWIATAADEIVVTPGGELGSIGVLTGHKDISAALEMAGEKVTLISAGKKKVDANPFEPLSEEARADLQGRVDAYYATFVSAVAKGRGVNLSAVRGGFGEGSMVGAAEAVKLGMADRVGTLDAAISRAGGRSGFQATSGYVQVEGYEITEDFTFWTATEDEPEPESSDGDTDLRERRLALQELAES